MTGVAVVHSSATNMSIQSNCISFLFFWTLSLVVQLSAYGHGHKAIKELAGNELAPTNSDRSVIQIAVEDGKGTDEKNLESAVSNVIDQDYALQKRDELTDIIGFSGIGGAAYILIHNISSVEPVLKRIWVHVRKTCFKQGETLPNGGCRSLDGKYIVWRGEMLEFIHESVFVFVISPKDCPQTIAIVGKRVFHNGKLIVQNIDVTDELLASSTYQRSADNSHWYTNLPVGELMTEERIREFKKLQWQIKQAKEHVVNGIFDAVKRKAKRVAKCVDEQRRRAVSYAKDGISKGIQSGANSRGRSNVLDELGSNTPQSDDEYDSGYDSVLSHLEDGSAFCRYGSPVWRDATGGTPSTCGSIPQRISREPRPSTSWVRLTGVARMLKLLINARHARESISRGGSGLKTPSRVSSGEGLAWREKSPRGRPGSGCGLFKSKASTRTHTESQSSP